MTHIEFITNKTTEFIAGWIKHEHHFLGRIQNHAACLILIILANLGSMAAVTGLINRLNILPPSAQTASYYRWIGWIFTKKGFDTTWALYYRSRNALLGSQLQRKNRPASKRYPNLLVFSQLFLATTQTLINPNPENTEYLVYFSRDQDLSVCNQSIELLRTIQTKAAFSKICFDWNQTRDSSLENIIRESRVNPNLDPKTNMLVRFLREEMDFTKSKDISLIDTLVNILLKEEPRFQNLASFVLRSLSSQSLINRFCDLWETSRNPHLEKILVQSQYSASSPLHLFLITRIKINKNLKLIKITPEKIPLLIQYINDRDSEIAHHSKNILINLSDAESQTAFLELFIQETPDFLLPIIHEINFKTKRLDLLAMVYFMAEDWQNYEVIDFNQQFLSTYFYNTGDEMRKKILKKMQKSGKPQFASILFSKNQSFSQKNLTHAEVETSINLLQHYENWNELWKLCQDTYIDLAITIFNVLRSKNWQPTDTNQQQLFNELNQINLPENSPSIPNIINAIPFAVPISVLKFKGRINDVAFGGENKLLAMATNQRAVLLWNYKQGKAQQLIRGFNHSVGLLTYSENDQLYIGEKTNGQDLCDVWSWSEQRLTLIGSHHGSITSIHPIHNDLLITTGKDKRLVAWNPHTKSAINEIKLGWWPRASFYHTDTKTISLFNTFRIEYSVPEFKHQPYQFVQSNPAVRTSVERDIQVLPKTKEVLIGQNNGQIVLNQYNVDKKFYQQQLIHQIPSNLIGLTNTTGENEFIALGKDGEIHLFDLMSQKKSLHHQVSDHFTSFQISPDRALFATGTKTAETVLWDLRPNRIKQFFQQPISTISNQQWAVLKFIEKNAALEKTTKSIITFCNRLLEFRFKFDIELSSIDELSPGEFDIEIEF